MVLYRKKDRVESVAAAMSFSFSFSFSFAFALAFSVIVLFVVVGACYHHELSAGFILHAHVTSCSSVLSAALFLCVSLE